MNWLLLTLLSAITASFSRLLQKKLLSDSSRDAFAFGFLFQTGAAGVFLLYTLLTGTFLLPDFSQIWLHLIAMTVFYSVANVSVFSSFKYAEASEVSILLATSSVWAIASAVLFLGERLHAQDIIGIVCIVIGVLAVQYTPSNWKLSKGHFFALLAACLFGIAFTNDAYIISHFDSLPTYLVIAFVLPGLTSLLYKPKSVYQLSPFLQKNTIASVVTTCVLYAVSALCIFSAYKLGGQASVISPIQQTHIIFTVVLGYFLLEEKSRLWQKVIGTVLTFAGVLLLV